MVSSLGLTHFHHLSSRVSEWDITVVRDKLQWDTSGRIVRESFAACLMGIPAC